MSLPQSNIDWSKYMEGLQGKTNLDLNNVEVKLADSFIDKLAIDLSSEISINNGQKFKLPTAGICIVNSAIGNGGDAQAGIEVFDKEDVVRFVLTNRFFHTGSWGNASIATPILEKGCSVKISSLNANYSLFYPLKGAN